MKKKTIWTGLIIVVFLTLVLAAGIFLMDRYNGLNNARGQAEDAQEVTRALVINKIDLTTKLLAATTELKDTDESQTLQKSVNKGKSILAASTNNIFSFELTFKKEVNDYIDAINEDTTLKQKAEVTSVLGELSGNDENLNDAKIAYNEAVTVYGKKRLAHPQFVAPFLGFTSLSKFTNIDTVDSQE